jgi:hypothetical protein
MCAAVTVRQHSFNDHRRQFHQFFDKRQRDSHSAASLALLLFLGFPAAFFSTGAKNFPV